MEKATVDRMWLTRTDRIETVIRGATAGSIAGVLFAAFQMVAAVEAGNGALWPWRMAASVVLGREALVASAGVALFAGVLVHLLLSVASGVTAAILYEWSQWSRTHRANPALACFAGAGFGALVWLVNFAVIAQAFVPWMWRPDQGLQLALHLGYGVALGLALRELGRHAMNPPDAARPA
ncbi:uncharacterized protein SOCE26_019380 [Sorangium cellulosum]|uniref:Uncharacterized protein n=1 Tax=Sorangium cellulosum TaxID=56 RepID=A0A2L0EML0_SORCE|nr:hypothetical protein [Sorangium cellulosum]AUX40537.1 uncharacterized protein SOCE26_019380 [Sorangium cellulosum]